MELLYILLSLTLFLVIVHLSRRCKYGNITTEGWQDYQLCPYGDVRSGSDPLFFYNYNKYRKPYRWPFRYYSSYPWPHLEPGL